MKILNRWTGTVIWESPCSTMSESIKKAISAKCNLRGSNLRGSNLSDCDLSDCDLRGSDLRDCDLRVVRADFLAEVLNLPNELEFLRDALIAGRVDGSTYSGTCACLAGTLAHAKGIEFYHGETIRNGREFVADSASPRERFFMLISKGETPENNPARKIALDWTEEAIAIRDNIRKVIVAVGFPSDQIPSK